MTQLDLYTYRYGTWLIKHRMLVLVLSLLAIFGISSGVTQLKFVSDARIFFNDEDPRLLAFEALERTFTKNDDALIVIHNSSGGIFNADTLLAVSDLTDVAWQLPYAYRVDSITNFQHTYALDDDLVVEDLVNVSLVNDAAYVSSRKQVAVNEPRLVNRIISPDALTTAVLVSFQIPEDSEGYLWEIVPGIRSELEKFEARYPQLEFYLTGNVPLDMAFEEATIEDGVFLMPLMAIAIALIIAVMVRSLVATVGVIVAALASALVGLGLAGFFGISMSLPTIPAPMMVMTLAVADSVHLITGIRHFMREGENKHDAIISSIKTNFVPLFLTTFTTAVGFLALNFNDSPPFKALGNVAAMGIIAAFLLSLTILPAFIALMPFKVKETSRAGRVMGSLAEVVIKYRGRLLWTLAILSVCLIVFIPANQLSNNFVKVFDERTEFRTDTDFTMANLTGINMLEFSIPSHEGNGIAGVEYLANLDSFIGWLRKQPEVVHVSGLSDTLKRLNMNMNNDDPGAYRLPDSRELSAQYILLYEMSLPYGLDLNNEVNIDKSATRLVVALRDVTTEEISAIAARSEAWLEANAPSLFAPALGSTVIFANIYERTSRGLIIGTLVSLFVISVVLGLALRSFKYGLVALVPNLLPAALAFGFWGLFVAEVNLGASMVLTLTLGIVVDDTVHFISKYLRARRDRGFDSMDAVRYAFSSTGVALVTTTTAIVAGFLILAQSLFAINAQSAILTALTISLALVVDLLLLPPLLMLVDRKRLAKQFN